jgi:biopolymer transport protein ExbD
MSAMDTEKHEKRSSSTAVPYINVTPLIDVLLVLLIHLHGCYTVEAQPL